jgi:hypothetical protein
MHFLLLITLLLSGCSSQAAVVEQRLNQYAQAAANDANLEQLLAGQALQSAIETRALIDSLGLQSFGSTRFLDTKKVSGDWFTSCLDVSGTSFRDANGEQLFLERLERQVVRVQFTAGKVADLKLEEEPC